MDEDSFYIEYEKENIIIDGMPYPFTVFFSAEDCFTLIDGLDHKPDQCRQSVAEYIRTRLDIPEGQKPSVDRIMAQGDDFFADIFELICRGDNTLKSLYEVRTDDTDVCHQFVSALKIEFKDVPLKQLGTGSIPKIQVPQIPSNVFETSRIAIERWDKISESVTAAYTNMCNVVSAFAQYSDTWFERIQQSIEVVYQIGNRLSEILQTIYIPELSEERKEQLRVSHETWGKYGWTQPPSAPDTFLDRPPTGRKDANAKALAYCKNSDMEELFSALLDLPHVKKSDVNEAMFAFRNRQYKSCALILFTLIDARLIRLQRNEDRRKKDNYREVGKGAAKGYLSVSKKSKIYIKRHLCSFHMKIFSTAFWQFLQMAKILKFNPKELTEIFLAMVC